MKRRSRTGGRPNKRTKPLRRNAPKSARPGRSAITHLTRRVALLTRERDEALEYQGATSEVLRAISHSAADPASTLGAIAESVARLIDVSEAEIMRREGNTLRSVAKLGSSKQWPLGTARPINRDWVTGRAVIDLAVVHVHDLQAQGDEFPEGAAYARQYGHRTILAVPLLREGSAIGAFLIRRMEVKPFTDKQIELVKTFADEAAIAIENARLLNELHQRTSDLTESLEQQTATSEVLRIISTSSGELPPVFEAMLANAVRQCEARYGALWLREGAGWRNAAFCGELPEAYTGQWRSGMVTKAGVDAPMDRVAKSRKPVHLPDCRTDQSYLDGHPLLVNAVDVGGIRTYLGVPMVKSDEVVGVIAIYRQEVRPFSDKQIELVTNFAAQAVIAIENTRLLNELRQSLEQQTAAADVLRVISSSLGELDPVFHAMLENAVRICEAKFGTLYLREADAFRAVATHNA
ncbi:MAG: GAF domain-containing protein, partial [Xanthobacteraceae bacterium]